MKRLLGYAIAVSCAVSLGWPTLSSAGNNLGLIPSKGVHYGIVKRNRTTITVALEKSVRSFQPDMNDNYLEINDVPAGTVDARPVYDGTVDGIPFATAFPNGAYELIDYDKDLLASRGCIQQKAENAASWDNTRVYCDKTGIGKIKVAVSTGNDIMLVDADVTATVLHKCHGAQAACGHGCLLPEAYTCCDPTPAPFAACWVATGGTCLVDTTFCEP